MPLGRNSYTDEVSGTNPMNYLLAKEVGVLSYLLKRILWRCLRASGSGLYQFRLPSGALFAAPKESMCAADVYVCDGIVDWGSENVLIEYLRIRNDGTFVDVGANVGYYSALVSPVVKRGFMFDPDPRNAVYLEMFAQTQPKFTYCPQAVSDYEGPTAFTLGSESSVSALGKCGKTVMTVDCVTLDSVFDRRNSEVAAIKMDVEGHELAALRGAKTLIRRERPVVVSEFSIDSGKPNRHDELLDLAAELDCAIYAITRHDPLWYTCSFTMEAVDAATFRDRWYKMIFLVPKEDRVFATVLDRIPSMWRSNVVSGRGSEWPFTGSRT
jgi:FkbM family methyltransferase